MTSLIRLGIVVLLGFVSTTAAARPMPASEARCAFDVYTPLAVIPFAVEEDLGHGLVRQIKGVRVFIDAEPGLTERGLLIRLHREVAQPWSSPIARLCRPEARELDVAVFAGEGGFWVELSATDERSAASVLRWAQRGLPGEEETGMAAASAR